MSNTNKKKSSPKPTRRAKKPLRPPTRTDNLDKTPLKMSNSQENSTTCSFKDSSSIRKTKKKSMRKEQYKKRSLDKHEKAYKMHVYQTFQAFKFIRKLPPMDFSLLKKQKVHLNPLPSWKKTVIFDLDETLVHCLENSSNSPDVSLTIKLPSGQPMQIGINIRPFARECIAEASKFFEVIVFTASQQCYADAILNHLDPSKECIHHRFYREHCMQVDGVLVKDLRIFANRNLKNVVLVDNAAYSYGYQIDNGIPIVSWYDDYNDKELFNLIEYLHLLNTVRDVRTVNKTTFRLHTFYEDFLKEIKHYK